MRWYTRRLPRFSAEITRQQSHSSMNLSLWPTRKTPRSGRRRGIFALTGKASDAVRMVTSGLNAWRSTGATVWVPLYLSYLAKAYADIGYFDDAWRCIDEAMTAVETTKEELWEWEIHRTAGEIA